MKHSKCSFGASEVEYLVHIVGHKGVRADLENIHAMQEWIRPMTLRSLCGFLGLTDYYRKFFHHYEKIAGPLTNPLKKNAFTWIEVAKQAFSALKQSMCTTPVLVVPDFTKQFVLECDASSKGSGEMLTKEGHPLAFTSK